MRIILLALLLVGCSSIPKGLSDFERDSYLKMGEYDRVLKDMEAKSLRVKDKDLLLHKLNYAMVLHYAGQYRKSNQVLTECQSMIDWGNELPEAEKILGKIFSPNVKQFQLDEYEILTISFVKMLNALLLGQIDNARAESRRLEKVGLFLKQHKKTDLLEESDSHYYFSGLIWDSLKSTDFKELDMAYVNYKRAYFNRSKIKYLPFDLARVATLSGREKEASDYLSHPSLKESYPKFVKSNQFKNSGEVIVIFSFGLGPRKSPDPSTNDLYLMAVPRTDRVDSLKISVNDEEFGSSSTVLDLDVLAKKNWDERKSAGFVGHLGNATGLYNGLDTRSWDLVFKRVQVARVMLEEGVHQLEMEVVGDGDFIKRTVEVKKGKKTFIHIHYQ